MSIEALVMIAFGLGVGAFCKGVTGMGLPLLAIPIMALNFELAQAIAIMMVPGIVTNAWQVAGYRARSRKVDFLPRMLVAGVIGIALGTWMLKATPGPVLYLIFALLLFAYIAMRLLKPSFRISMDQARRLSAPTLFAGGLLQGAFGVAAPAVVTFFNAVRFDRDTYIFAISSVYLALSAFQLLSLTGAGLMRPAYLLQGLFALIPVAVMMPLGAVLGRHISPRGFDLIVLAMLFAIALRFAWRGLAG